MFCQCCGAEAETKYVSFHQNVGALAMRFTKTMEGSLCKNCINKHFWSMTGITAVFGWWGIISAVLTPIFLLNNIIRYLGCLTLPKPETATPATLTSDAVEKLSPYIKEIVQDVNAG